MEAVSGALIGRGTAVAQPIAGPGWWLVVMRMGSQGRGFVSTSVA